MRYCFLECATVMHHEKFYFSRKQSCGAEKIHYFLTRNPAAQKKLSFF